MKFRLIAEDSVEPRPRPTPKRRVEVRFEADLLGSVLEEVTMFLRGCGFVFNGELDAVEPE